MARATGEIVAYINSDDYYLPARSTTAVRRLEESALAGCRCLPFLHDEAAWTRSGFPSIPGTDATGGFWSHGEYRRLRRSGGARCSSAIGKFREDMHYAFETKSV